MNSASKPLYTSSRQPRLVVAKAPIVCPQEGTFPTNRPIRLHSKEELRRLFINDRARFITPKVAEVRYPIQAVTIRKWRQMGKLQNTLLWGSRIYILAEELESMILPD